MPIKVGLHPHKIQNFEHKIDLVYIKNKPVSP